MTEAIILPFYNRYSSPSVSQSTSGLFAYGSRSDIFVIDVLNNRAFILYSKCLQVAHTGRVSCVSFSKNEDVELLASIGEEGVIKVWNLETKRCVNEGQVYGSVAEWASGSSDVLFYALDSRHLAKWFISSNTVRKIKTGTEIPITVMASNKTNLLAVGHHNGHITIIDIIQEKILQKLRSHSQDIINFSWNPTSPEMLLTASLDLSLRSWKIGEDKPVNSYHIPVGKVRFDDKKKVNIFGIWHPRNKDIVICSNFRGEVGEICLSKGETPKFSPITNIDLSPKGCIFPFTFPKKTEKEMQDLLILFDIYKFRIWNICEKKVELQLPFLMGFVIGLSISPINPNLMAISNGDGILRVWNAQAESVETNMAGIYVHYKTKIMSAAWHPVYDNIIAYGTDEGRVAIIDIFKKKSVYTFETYHTEKVYTVCWGPFKHLEGSKENEFFVYSCGSCSILINRLNHSKDPALDFDDFASVPPFVDSTKSTHSEVCWKADFSCLLTGSYKGFIDVYDAHLIFMNRYSVEMKSIECMAWHPERTYASPDGSPFKFWFASCGNDTNLYIFNSTKTFVKHSLGEQNSNWESKKLVGHKKRIVSVCWSQHNDGHLASASRDGSVLIWNVCTGTVIASYLHHEDNVLGVQWSVTDPDVIYSGGEDNSVRIWKISEQAANLPKKGPLKRKAKKNLNKNLKGIKSAEISLEAENEESFVKEIEVDKNDLSDQNEDETFPTITTRNCTREGLPASEKLNAESEIKRLKAQFSMYVKPSRLFPCHSLISYAPKEDELKDCLQLADVLKEKEIAASDENQILDSSKHSISTLTNEDILKLGPFTDQMTALKMLEIQAENFKPQENCHHFCQLSVMSSNVKTLLEYAAVNKKLSSYHVSLAPSVSYAFWLEMCEKFAKQLLEEHQYNQACTYFLLCNKVYEAIDIFAEKIDILEALILAKARLPESDPMIRSLLFRVRKKYVSHNNSARVAKCYLSLKQPLTAAKTLFTVSDPKFMKAAIYIAKLNKLKNETKRYMYLYMVKYLSLDDWNALADLENEEPSMKVYSSLFAVHKAFKIHLQYLRKTDEDLEKEIFFQPDSSKPIKFWIGNTCMESKESFIKYVYHILLSNNLIPSETEEIFNILKALGNMFTGKETYDCVVQADILISLCITQYIFYCILEDRTAANFYFLKIFESSYNDSFFLKAVCALFIPMSLSWDCDTCSIICESKTDNGEESNTVLCQFHNINQAITGEITSFRPECITSKFCSKDSCPLPPSYENVVDDLKRKPINEYVLTYFVANIAQNLRRLVDREEMICCAEKLCVPKLQKEDIEPIPSEELENGILIQTPKEIEDESNPKMVAVNSTIKVDEIENLIKIALEEADEKAKSFLSASKAPENDADYEVSIQETSQKCVDINNENSSEIITEVNVTNSAELPKLINDEINGKECLAISSNDENSEISQCIVLEDKSCADISEEKSSKIIINEESLEISSNDENSHVRCLAKNDLFFNLVLFIISSISKQEFVYGHYLIENACIKKKLELYNTKDKNEPFDESNPKMDEMAVSSETEESHNFESFEMVENGEFANGILKIDEKKMNDNDENRTEQSVNSIQHVELFNEIDNANGIPSTEINNMEINNLNNKILTEPTADCIYNTGLCEENNVHCIPSTSTSEVNTLQVSVPNGNKMECGKNISNTVVDSDSSEMELSPVHKICANSFQIVNPFGEDILKELNINEKKIHVLINESHASLLSYPVPFEVLQNVLQAMYFMWQKSECPVVQEELHKYMEQIIHYLYSFSDGKMKLRCEICVSK